MANSSNSVAAVAIVVLVIVALIFIFGRLGMEDEANFKVDLPNIEVKDGSS